MAGRKPVSEGGVTRQSITLPADVAVRVKALAERRRVPVGAILREFVMVGLERQALLDRLADAVDPMKVAV